MNNKLIYQFKEIKKELENENIEKAALEYSKALGMIEMIPKSEQNEAFELLPCNYDLAKYLAKIRIGATQESENSLCNEIKYILVKEINTMYYQILVVTKDIQMKASPIFDIVDLKIELDALNHNYYPETYRTVCTSEEFAKLNNECETIIYQSHTVSWNFDKNMSEYTRRRLNR